ncbi:transcription initiation factor TFIID component TAF4 family-domain-containing protein [Vararia minispora EC-137]|uniref:Transcription initiation factor TFIID component TAF4 family-domain-containing protein n=1 Tax=Vararia minispora EC-137 TaxID=1314806 RepID=A0ACB8QK37_9AGAM|nr:transcription initiation factor TFIID component TAF4 family-domain-containing protein [Vararia minispora EC-137]
MSTPASAAEESKASPAPQTPNPQTSYPQWTSAAHPHYQYQYHYPYGGYHQYVPQTTSGQGAQTAAATTPVASTPVRPATASSTIPPPTTAAAATTAASSTAVNQSQLDTTDVSKLNDALGGGLVDLKVCKRAEEESLQRTSDQHQVYRNSYDDRSHKQPSKPYFDTRYLGATMRAIGKKHKVETVPEESINYVALALRTRLQDLVNEMISASAHRTGSGFDRAPSKYEDGTPMWSVAVNRDVAKQLAALERVEREEEMRTRRERKELAAQVAAASGLPGPPSNAAADAPSTEEEGPKKKKKKVDGPGVTAKNMSEDLRKKMSNQVASHAAGFGSKYSWMNAGVTPTPPKPRPAASSSAAAASPSPAAGGSSSTASSWSKPYVSATKPSTTQAEDSKQLVTLRDALFVVERDKGHGGGRGAARGWS